MGFWNMLGMKNKNDIERELIADGFKIDKRWEGTDQTMMLCLEHRMIFIVNNICRKKDKDYTAINFDDILDVEIVVDKQEITKKSGLGRAVAGGILLGGVGAIVGGITGNSKSEMKFKNIEIVLKLKSILKPMRTFTCSNIETSSTGWIGKAILNDAQDCYETLMRAKES